jgi:hypothetical protein
MTARAPMVTLALIREALEAGGSCYEVTLRLDVAPQLVRAVITHMFGQGPEPDPCSWCGGVGWDRVAIERCPHCRGIGMRSPEA